MELGHILGFFWVPAMAGTSLKNPHWGSSSQILDERCRFRMVQIMISGDKVGLIFGLPSHDYLVGGCHPSEKNMNQLGVYMKFPIYGKSSNSMVPNHQPVIND